MATQMRQERRHQHQWKLTEIIDNKLERALNADAVPIFGFCIDIVQITEVGVGCMTFPIVHQYDTNIDIINNDICQRLSSSIWHDNNFSQTKPQARLSSK